MYVHTLLFLCRHIYIYIHKVHSCKVSQPFGKPNMSVVETWTMYFFDRNFSGVVFATRKRTILLMLQKSGVRKLRLIVYPCLSHYVPRVLYIPGGAGFLPSMVLQEITHPEV